MSAAAATPEAPETPTTPETPDAPYRNPAPPCERCLARTVAALAMEPFQEERDIQCPACHHGYPSMFSGLCRGRNTFIVERGKPATGWWFWKTPATPDRVVACPVDTRKSPTKTDAPAHIHFKCRHCELMWIMRVAREDL